MADIVVLYNKADIVVLYNMAELVVLYTWYIYKIDIE